MKNHYHRLNFAKNAVIYIKKIIYGYFKGSFNFCHKFTNIFCFSVFRIFSKEKKSKGTES